jgi:hypothetical protein
MPTPAGRKPRCTYGIPVCPLPSTCHGLLSRDCQRITLIYSFDVTMSTHDLLKAGVVAARLPGSPNRHHRIVVAAESRNEAALIAAQMATWQGVCTCTGGVRPNLGGSMRGVDSNEGMRQIVVTPEHWPVIESWG